MDGDIGGIMHNPDRRKFGLESEAKIYGLTTRL
jgi:hypothetical protein